MNKTVTINLSGIVFHIDENAYDTLKKYLESIRSKFTAADGRDEIVQDIEARIAEMFQQRISANKQAILPDDVNAVIAILGKPEDIGEASETPSATGTVTGEKGYTVKKRFFRSPDDKILGGVCGGISAYFDIDPIWLRLAFALCFFFAGSGILLYIILWVIVPLAKTPSEKLQMHGEDVTLSAIQKSVQEEMGGVKKKAGEMVNEVRSKNYGRRLSDFIKEVVVMFFKVIGKIFSVIAIIISVIILFALTELLFGLFGLFGFTLHYPLIAPRIDIIFGLIGLLLIFNAPAVLLFLAGLKRLFKINWNLRRVSGILAGLMLIGVGICLITALNITKYYSTEASVYKTVAWQVPREKVLLVKLNPESVTSGTNIILDGSPFIGIHDHESFILASVGRLSIVQSTADSVELVTDFNSRGIDRTEAYSLARKIKYNFAYSDTTLSLDPSFNSIGENEPWRAQKVTLILKIPVNTSIKLDKDLEANLGLDIETVDDLKSDSCYGHTFTMTTEGLKCTDCK